MGIARDGISAASEATFPKTDLAAPDFESTQMVERTLEYLDELPPAQRRLLIVLFVFVELGAVFLIFGFRRFSRLHVRRRTRAISEWRRSRFLALRVLGDSVKATTTMMYMSHPAVLEHIGEYRVCDRPLDRVRLRVLPDALARDASSEAE